MGLWMHNKHKVFGEELYTLIEDWLKNNDFKYDDNIVGIIHSFILCCSVCFNPNLRNENEFK